MPMRVTIDPSRHLILVQAWGTITGADLLMHRQNLQNQRAADQSYNQLHDYRAITKLHLASHEVQELATTSPARYVQARYAVVVSHLARFGMARMFQSYADLPSETFRVMTTLEEALQWLGISDMAMPPIDSADSPDSHHEAAE